MGLVDRALAAAKEAVGIVEDLAPEWGLRRAAAQAKRRILNQGYGNHGANRTKNAMRGWGSSPGGPDSDIVENLDTLRDRSRDLFMGEPLAVGALKTIRSNEIGAGLRLNASIDAVFLGLTPEAAQAWEDRVEREFAIWATRSCDASRRCTFGELQALARLSQLMSGDVFALLPAIARKGERYDLRVHLIEADRVSDPLDPRAVPMGVQRADILGGVEVGPFGEPVAYYIADRHPNETIMGGLRSVGLIKWSRVPAFGEATGRPLVLHLMESERPGQRRGVPLLAPVIEKLKQLSRYSDAELMAAVVSGYFTAAITSTAPVNPIGSVIPEGDKIAADEPDKLELGTGTVLGLAPGESLTAVNPARPNAGFEPFVAAVLKQVGAGLGIPFELLVMQFDSSYSASRAALLEAWKRFTVGRAWLVTGFCQPIYEQWLEEAIARGYVQAPGFFSDPLVRAAWCGAKWIGPTQGQLDPTKEVEAAAQRVKEGFSTRTEETMALTGGDFWDNNALRGREELARGAAGLAGAKPALVLTPTDVASIATVDEGRASVGLPPIEGAEGEAWIVEHTADLAPTDPNAATDNAAAALTRVQEAAVQMRRAGLQLSGEAAIAAQTLTADLMRAVARGKATSPASAIAALECVQLAAVQMRRAGLQLSGDAAEAAQSAIADLARAAARELSKENG